MKLIAFLPFHSCADAPVFLSKPSVGFFTDYEIGPVYEVRDLASFHHGISEPHTKVGESRIRIHVPVTRLPQLLSALLHTTTSPPESVEGGTHNMSYMSLSHRTFRQEPSAEWEEHCSPPRCQTRPHDNEPVLRESSAVRVLTALGEDLRSNPRLYFRWLTSSRGFQQL